MQETVESIAAFVDSFFKDALEKCCGKSDMCDMCCTGCAEASAHFDYAGSEETGHAKGSKMAHIVRAKAMKENPKAKTMLQALKTKHGWDHRAGFLGEKGCKLPRTERSVYCQETQCRHIGEILAGKSWTLLYEKLAMLKDIRKENGLLI